MRCYRKEAINKKLEVGGVKEAEPNTRHDKNNIIAETNSLVRVDIFLFNT